MTRTLFALGLVGLLLFAGCGEGTPPDPYAKVSLHQALYGPPVLSKGFKYKLVGPEIVDAAGDYVLVREGNVSTFITGSSIADKIAGHDAKTITYNVVKKFTPAPHFRAREVIAGNDTIPIPSGRTIPLPPMTSAAKFNSDDYKAIDMGHFRWNDTIGLQKETNKKYALKAKLVKTKEGKDEVWMLEGTEPAARGVVPTLRVTSPSPAMEIVFDLIAKSGQEFDGGITFTDVEAWPKRQKNHVCGTVDVDYAHFLDRVFKGSSS